MLDILKFLVCPPLYFFYMDKDYCLEFSQKKKIVLELFGEYHNVQILWVEQ